MKKYKLEANMVSHRDKELSLPDNAIPIGIEGGHLIKFVWYLVPIEEAETNKESVDWLEAYMDSHELLYDREELEEIEEAED